MGMFGFSALMSAKRFLLISLAAALLGYWRIAAEQGWRQVHAAWS
jgi:hypothetical protein